MLIFLNALQPSLLAKICPHPGHSSSWDWRLHTGSGESKQAQPVPCPIRNSRHTHTHTHTHTHAADSQVSRLPPAIFLLQHSPLPLPGSALSKLRSGTFSRASTACSHPSLIDTPLTIHLKILRVTGCPGAGWTPDPSATTFRCPCASDQRAVASHQHI